MSDSKQETGLYRTHSVILAAAAVLLGVAFLVKVLTGSSLQDRVRVLENKVERLERTCIVKGDLVKKGHGTKEAHP